MKRYLICGAAGMVGSALLSRIADSFPDAEVFAADISIDGIRHWESERIHPVLNEQIEGILSSTHIDICVLLAFPRNVEPRMWAPGIQFCYDCLSLAKRFGAGRVIHISSQSIYGWDRNDPANESSQVSLSSPYTTSKFCIEQTMKVLFPKGRYTSIRLSTIIGPKTKERVVNKFIEQVVTGNDLTVRGGEQVFSFLDIKDAVDGLAAIIAKDNIDWEAVYNLGTSAYYTLYDIADMVIAEGKNRRFVSSSIIHIPEDIHLNNRIDVSLFHRDFAWMASRTLEESIREIFNEIQSSYGR